MIGMLSEIDVIFCENFVIETFHTKTRADLNLGADKMLFCEMNNAILVNRGSNKGIVITGGVTTCFVIMIFHPQSALTLFSHVDSAHDNIVEIQNEFISIFTKKELPLEELHVYLAGGTPSHFDSKEKANLLINFWEEKPVKLNAALLLSRDSLVIENVTEFYSFLSNVFKIDYPEISFQDISAFFKDIITDGNIYNVGRFENKEYPIDKNSIYSNIESVIGHVVESYLKIREICDSEYVNNTKLQIVQRIHNPANEIEEKVLVNFHDPFKSVLHLVGFNFEANELFVSTDDCVELMTDVDTRTNKEFSLYNFIIPIFDFSSSESQCQSEILLEEIAQSHQTIFDKSAVDANGMTLGSLLAQSLATVTNQSTHNSSSDVHNDLEEDFSAHSNNHFK